MSTTEVPSHIRDIYDQIGGNRAMAMAFASWHYDADAKSATFAIAPALRRQVPDRITHVRVTLDPDDTYRVEFLSVTTARPAGREVSLATMVYADSLRRTVEMRTGLTLSLGTMGRVQAVAP